MIDEKKGKKRVDQRVHRRCCIVFRRQPLVRFILHPVLIPNTQLIIQAVNMSTCDTGLDTSTTFTNPACLHFPSYYRWILALVSGCAA